MTTKIFHLVAQKLSSSDFQDFKENLNQCLKSYTGRTLNKSKLHEFASQVLCAKDSNVLSAMLKKSSVSDIVKTYMDTVSCFDTVNKYPHLLKHSTVPIFEFSIGGDRVELGVEIFYQDKGVLGDKEIIELDVYVNAPDVDIETDSLLGALCSNGGDNLTSMARTVFTSSEPLLFDIFEPYGLKNSKPSKPYITPMISEIYGLKKSNFDNFTSFEQVESYISTCLVMIAGDINMRLAQKGKAMSISLPTGGADPFTVTMKK